eukprot:3498185-Pleurochrysis_carterae.AAC.1
MAPVRVEVLVVKDPIRRRDWQRILAAIGATANRYQHASTRTPPPPPNRRVEDTSTVHRYWCLPHVVPPVTIGLSLGIENALGDGPVALRLSRRLT